MSSNKKKLIFGIGVDAFGTAIAMIVGVMAIPFMLLYVSKEEYGAWLAINGLVSLVSIADIGTDQYLMTVISNEKSFKSKYFGDFILSTFILKFFIALFVITVAFLVYMNFSSLVIMDTDLISPAKNTFLIAIATLIFTLFANTFNTLLYGRKHFSLVSATAAISSIAVSIITVILLKTGLGIESFPLAIIFTTFLQYIFIIHRVNKIYPHITFRLKGFKFKNKTEMISYSTSFQILRWVSMFKSHYIVIAINNLIGPAAAAVYSLTAKLPQLNMMLCSKISSPFFPFLAQYVSDDEEMKLASRAFIKLTKIVLRFSIFFTILTFALTKPFVSLWVGDSNYAGNDILFIVCLMSLISSSLASFSFVVFATKKFENWVFFSICEIVLAVVISYVLSGYYGLLGIILGFAFTSLITFVYLVKIVLRQLKINLITLITEGVRYSLLTNISTIFTAIVSIKYLNISSWFQLFFVAIIFALFHLIFTEGRMIMNSKVIGFKGRVIQVIKDELTI